MKPPWPVASFRGDAAIGRFLSEADIRSYIPAAFRIAHTNSMITDAAITAAMISARE
jgi:hypothetical protein